MCNCAWNFYEIFNQRFRNDRKAEIKLKEADCQLKEKGDRQQERLILQNWLSRYADWLTF